MVVVGLGSVATLSERKRESASETVKKRTRDEKRGNKRTRRVGDVDGGGGEGTVK